MNFWQQDKWNGFFSVKWHIIKDVPNPQFRHIILENNENKPVTNSRDTQEVCLIAFQYLTRDSWYFFYRLESFVSYFFVSRGHAKKFMSISCYCPCGCCWNNLVSYFFFVSWEMSRNSCVLDFMLLPMWFSLLLKQPILFVLCMMNDSFASMIWMIVLHYHFLLILLFV